MAAKYGARGPFVDVGGLERPTIADYSVTVHEMAQIPVERWFSHGMRDENIRRAQYARYQDITRPLSFLDPDYAIENPETGGLDILGLADLVCAEVRRPYGTVICLSVLEHVDDPFGAAMDLNDILEPGGIAIVSVPFMFPEHRSPSDFWRFTPDALRYIFASASERHRHWEICEAGWRLRIPANAGVMDIRSEGTLQAIESCYIVARRK